MSDWEKEVRQLAMQGKKIEAVKLYREANGCSLLEAKTAVEQMESSMLSGEGNSVEPPELDKAVLEEILRLLRDYKKFDAVKLYMDHMKMSLMDSKREVEAIAAHFGIGVPAGKGCLGVILFTIGLAACDYFFAAWR